MPPLLPPFALPAPAFRFRHLAALAGRAPIGGTREVALACFVAARLAAECADAPGDEDTSRSARALGAKAWLGTLSLPAAVRGPAAKCAELSVAGSAAEMGRELGVLAGASASYLDVHSRAELELLSGSLRAGAS